MRKGKRIMALALVIFFLLAQLPVTVLADSGTDGDFVGEGSQGDPYRIYTAEDLQRLATLVNNQITNFKGKYFSLERDIDLSGISNWTPIGKSDTVYFSGHFDGKGHHIVGLNNTSKKSYIGLFGALNSATVQDIHLVNCNIYGNGRTAGIAGYAKESSITGCTVTGVIESDNQQTAGIAGYVEASVIEGCTMTGTIMAYSQNAGGIVGRLRSGSINNCYSELTLICNYMNIGGIAGRVDEGCVVSNSVSHSRIIGLYESIGGIVGYLNGSKIINCFSSGVIEGGYPGDNPYSSAGGIAGYVENSGAMVQNCYSVCDINVTGVNVGGIVGILDNGAVVRDCVALHQRMTSNGPKYQNVNRVVGDKRVGTLSHNYALTEMVVQGSTVTGGLASDVNGQGITLSDLSSADFWTNAGNWADGAWNSDVWTFANDHFPMIKNLEGCSEEAGKWDISMADVSVQWSADFTYNGKEIKPSFTMNFCGESLSEGRHYGTSFVAEEGYSDGIHAGNVKLRLSGQGFFGGAMDYDYAIRKRPVTVKTDDKWIKVGEQLSEITYTIEGAVEGDTVLAQPPEFDISTADWNKPGVYTIIVDPDSIIYTGNYKAASTVAQNGKLIVCSEGEATLSSLSFSEGKLEPAFSKDIFGYTLKVPGSVSSLTLAPTATEPNATIQVNGQVVESGTASQPITLSSDNETISIVVSTPSATETYTISVVRVSGDAKLSEIEINGLTLTPMFNSDTYAYSAGEVANVVDALTVIPVATHPLADITVDGQDVTSGAPVTVPLKTGENTIKIEVGMIGGTSYTYNHGDQQRRYNPEGNAHSQPFESDNHRGRRPSSQRRTLPRYPIERRRQSHSHCCDGRGRKNHEDLYHHCLQGGQQRCHPLRPGSQCRRS